MTQSNIDRFPEQDECAVEIATLVNPLGKLTLVVGEYNNSQPSQLDVMKQENHEMAEAEAVLTSLGELRGESDPLIWTGGSSLAERIASGEVTEDEVEQAVQYASTCYVKATPGARKRCVEDRTEEGYDDSNEEDYLAPLGPQVQGGTADEALAYRLSNEPSKAVSLVKDVEYVAKAADSDYAPGVHTQAHAASGCTGCGSVDHAKPKTELFNDPAAAPYVEALTGVLMQLNDQNLTAKKFAALQQSAKELLTACPDYFKELVTVPEVVKRVNPNGSVRVISEHKQVGLLINMIPATTFHTNHYNQRSNGELTMHNLDLWNVFEEHEEPEQIALIAQAVTTLMRITDGSLRVYVRTPKPALQIAA